jgi:hypothetical protein
VVYVKQSLTAAEEAHGLCAITPGQHVVTRGVVELKATLADLQARTKQSPQP